MLNLCAFLLADVSPSLSVFRFSFADVSASLSLFRFSFADASASLFYSPKISANVFSMLSPRSPRLRMVPSGAKRMISGMPVMP